MEPESLEDTAAATVPTDTSPVLVFIRGGAVQWAASSDLSACLVILDADSVDEIGRASCWQEGVIPFSEVEPELWEIAGPLIGAHDSNAGADPVARQRLARMTCKCGSKTWRISEHETTDFMADCSSIRPVAVNDRQIYCSSCGHAPTDGSRKAIEERYLAVEPMDPLVRAARAVVASWDGHNLAPAVRNLAQQISRLGCGITWP